MDTLKNPEYLADLPSMVRNCEAIRKDTKSPQDITLAEMVNQKFNITMDSFYEGLGINPNVDTIHNLVNMPDEGYRWLIPEIYRDALRLGLRKSAIHPALIAGEQSVSQLSVTWPAINMSEATPAEVGVGETITTGDLSFDQKTVKIRKYGRGIKIPYEITNYVALNVVGIFLEDMGVKMNMAQDNHALTTLLNGDQANGSDSAATIGIATANTLVFRDLLKPYVRMGRLGRNITTMVAGEEMAIDLLELLINTRLEGSQRMNINVKTPLPTTSDCYVHGRIAANQVLLVDPTRSMVKLNAQPILVETEKIVSNQTEATYVTFTSGFATLFRDARLVIDRSLTFAGNGFPTWMDPTSQEVVNYQK